MSVFLSYARTDQPLAARLARILQEAGIEVWWDRELLVGSDFAHTIAEQLDRATMVVVIWTPTSINSNWVRDEAGVAMHRGKLVPVLAGVSEAPIGFRSAHAVNLDGGLEQILTAVRAPPRLNPTIPESGTDWRGLAYGLLAAAALLVPAAWLIRAVLHLI